VIVVTGNTHPAHTPETVNALRFGETCGRIATEGAVDAWRASDAILAINAELAELEVDIKTRERWETRMVVRQDADGVEKMAVTVPVGAEVQRERYEVLLAARRELLGE
jgi:hypothetical protein